MCRPSKHKLRLCCLLIAVPRGLVLTWRSDWESNPVTVCTVYRLAICCITILPPLRKHIHELSVPLHLLYSVLDMFKLGSSNWARTSDPQINSLLLYQLSYRGINSTYNYTLAGIEPANTAVRQCYAPTISAWPTP